MPSAVVLETPRLRLRPVALADAAAIAAVASRRAVVDALISIPHPYPPGEAERSIAARRAERAAGTGETYTAVERDGGAFCGQIEIRDIDRDHRQAELSFWLAPERWGQGLMTEMVRAVTARAFGDLGLNRLYAHHMTRNPASGRVLAKAGFRHEGTLRQRVWRWGVAEDVELWGALADEHAHGA